MTKNCRINSCSQPQKAMIFKRKKSDDLSSTSNKGVTSERITPKIMTLYVAVICFIAACLSFVALEVGARSPLGHSVTKSATFNAIFRRSYNMKIKILVTNVVTGLVTTILLALGDVYRIPLLYVPWLMNTMRGMIFYEGPALLRLSYIWLPDTGIAAGTFIFLTFILYVEELCLWYSILLAFKECWLEYEQHKAKPVVKSEEAVRLTKTFEKCEDQIAQYALTKSRLWNETVEPIKEPALTSAVVKSTSSDTAIRLRPTKSFDDSKPDKNFSEIPNITI